jgi:Flp pilus assembly pilin Flp
LVIVVAGFLPPTIMPSVSTIFSKITSAMGAS